MKIKDDGTFDDRPNRDVAMTDDANTLYRAIILNHPWIKSFKQQMAWDDDSIIEAFKELQNAGLATIVKDTVDGEQVFRIELSPAVHEMFGNRNSNA